ncbi:helix-turn-helix domain-containing protein [Actibacterium lipolyticum]|uniref:HTH crp-type domain-containing protein n=1 Tax=Actibacterium lipolyticum TaxID=1524263 RepID=A0A238L7V4_9RHOB|nr:helix-turn-helix domain-containing protein [Actibacterium lipolyticum]SMX51164.1 hypothetical protein COL8621_03694 [Actibacterium lipolyticum]
MLAKKPVGRSASVIKYDLLTAMGTFALSEPKGPQRLIFRLLTLITARYNWNRDELAVGQREIARMWGVDERTVKREMAKLRAMGWLVVKRQGSRGRVTEYGIDIQRIFETTRPAWAAVGPDFAARMEGEPEDKVVPLPVKGNVTPPEIADGTEWDLARAVIYAEDPGLYAAWVQGLKRSDRAGGRLVLTAPSKFHATYVSTHMAGRLLKACQSVDGDVAELIVQA